MRIKGNETHAIEKTTHQHDAIAGKIWITKVMLQRKQCRNLTQNWYSPTFCVWNYYRSAVVIRLLLLYFAFSLCHSHAIKWTCSPGFVLFELSSYRSANNHNATNLETQVQCSYFFLSSSSSSSFVFCFLSFFALHPSLTHSLKSNCIGSPFDFYVCVFSLQSTESLTCFISLSVLKCENFAHALSNLNRNIKICWNKNEQINSPFLSIFFRQIKGKWRRKLEQIQ